MAVCSWSRRERPFGWCRNQWRGSAVRLSHSARLPHQPLAIIEHHFGLRSAQLPYRWYRRCLLKRFQRDPYLSEAAFEDAPALRGPSGEPRAWVLRNVAVHSARSGQSPRPSDQPKLPVWATIQTLRLRLHSRISMLPPTRQFNRFPIELKQFFADLQANPSQRSPRWSIAMDSSIISPKKRHGVVGFL